MSLVYRKVFLFILEVTLRVTKAVQRNQANKSLTPSWRGPLSYRNQSIDLQSKSMDWFLYDNSLCHERVKRMSDCV